MKMSDATVLYDIQETRHIEWLNSSRRIKIKPPDMHGENLRQFAIQKFAALNGWTIYDKSFPPEDIGKRRRSTFHTLDLHIFDHPLYFRGDGRCSAIVTQPYNAVTDAARALAHRLGIACHVAPHPTASFHNPGSTLFIVFAEPGHEMKWLPEQINGIAARTEDQSINA
jgi:hypothetical protein